MSTRKHFQIGLGLVAAVAFLSAAAPEIAQAACPAGTAPAPGGQWDQQTPAGIIRHIQCSHSAYRRAMGQPEKHAITADELQKEIQKQLDAKIKQENAAKDAAKKQVTLGPDTPPVPLYDHQQPTRWQKLVKERDAKCGSNALQTSTGMTKADLDWCKSYWKGKQQKPAEVVVLHSHQATQAELQKINELRKRLPQNAEMPPAYQ